jgi:hypothetical protein
MSAWRVRDERAWPVRVTSALGDVMKVVMAA